MISWAENGDARFPEALAAVYPRVGRAWRLGVTGPPGAGKSTLVNELARLLRAEHLTVGILAVDPSSPFSGGALLGDRIRMEGHAGDPGVFIRSMASRGSRGGIARASIDACDVMDAFGFDEIVIETVGVGQAEYDVVSAADTIAVVLCPGAGDGIQAMKAGLLEVADLLVVNKADLDGADRLQVDLEDALLLRAQQDGGWRAPVVRCSAGTGRGADDVLAGVRAHRRHLGEALRDERRRAKRLQQVQRMVSERLSESLWGERGWRAAAQALLDRDRTPYNVASELLDTLLGGIGARASGPHPEGGTEKEVGLS